MSKTFIENYKIVPCGVDIDFNTAASNLSDSINMKNYHRATFLIQLADIGTASPVLIAYSGATNAECTSALAFRYAFGSAAAGSATCDVLSDWTDCAATGLTLTHGTYDNYLLIVDIDASAMDMANDEEWLTLDFTDPGGATGQAIVLAVLEPRYPCNQSETAIA
jgi:hypothetical protein